MNAQHNQEGIIKCPSCGEMYQIAPEGLGERNAHFTCKCGHKIMVAFFTYCSSCGTIVGIDSGVHSYKELAFETTRKLIKGFNPLKRGVSGGPTISKDISLAMGQGQCMLCGTMYALCPQCRCGVEVEIGNDEHAPIFCTECGQKFRLR